jgi:hypothetical protein
VAVPGIAGVGDIAGGLYRSKTPVHVGEVLFGEWVRPLGGIR